jgi:threonine/homoserine/homoserine lactone efflux protein
VPSPSTFLLFAVASLVLVAIPGPAVIYIATRSLGQGRRVGVASALGIEVGTMFHITLAAVGLSALIRSSTVAFDAVKYLGVAYLALLGIRAMLRDGPLELDGARPGATSRRAFAEGVLVNVLNPKIALFFVAFLPQFIDPSRGSATTQILALGLVFVAIAATLDTSWALLAGTFGGWLRARPAFARRQRFITGGVYLALGAAAAVTGSGHRTS